MDAFVAARRLWDFHTGWPAIVAPLMAEADREVAGLRTQLVAAQQLHAEAEARGDQWKAAAMAAEAEKPSKIAKESGRLRGLLAVQFSDIEALRGVAEEYLTRAVVAEDANAALGAQVAAIEALCDEADVAELQRSATKTQPHWGSHVTTADVRAALGGLG
jgi:hypothetical protein